MVSPLVPVHIHIHILETQKKKKKNNRRLCLDAKKRNENKKGPSARMLFKITVLGDGGVGKTAITVQVSFEFPPHFTN